MMRGDMMKKVCQLLGILSLAGVLSGCMSMDEMLASDDPFWHDLGEKQAARFAIDAAGVNELQAKLDVVGKMRDQVKLATVYNAQGTDEQVRQAARRKITEDIGFAAIVTGNSDSEIRKDALKQIKSDTTKLAIASTMIEEGGDQEALDEVLSSVRDEARIVRRLVDLVKSERALAKQLKEKEYLTDSLWKADNKKLQAGYAEYDRLLPYVKSTGQLLALSKNPALLRQVGEDHDFQTPVLEVIEKRERAAKAEAERIAEEKRRAEREKELLYRQDPKAFAARYPQEWEKRQKEKEAAEAAAFASIMAKKGPEAASALSDYKKNPALLARIAREHESALIRLSAAISCGGDVLKETLAKIQVSSTNGNLVVAGVCLGLPADEAAVAVCGAFPGAQIKDFGNVPDFDMFKDIWFLTITLDGKDYEILHVSGKTGLVNQINLDRDLVARLFDVSGDLEEVGEKVFKDLGLKSREDYLTEKVKGLKIADQHILRYSAFSGAEVTFALAAADVDSDTIGMLAPSDFIAAEGFKLGCTALVEMKMKRPGTLILRGEKLPRK